jgi:hypothetical protein
MGNFFDSNAADIAPTESIKLLEKLREALLCAVTLSDEEIDRLVTELTFDGKERTGVHIPSYLAELKRKQIQLVQNPHPKWPRLPEKLDGFDEARASWQSAEYIAYKTAYTSAALMLARHPDRIGFKAEFGNSVRYPSSPSVSETVEINWETLSQEWRKIKAEGNYKHRKPSYIRWLRTLVKERGSDDQLEKLEEFFNSLDELEPIETAQPEPEW